MLRNCAVDCLVAAGAAAVEYRRPECATMCTEGCESAEGAETTGRPADADPLPARPRPTERKGRARVPDTGSAPTSAAADRSSESMLTGSKEAAEEAAAATASAAAVATDAAEETSAGPPAAAAGG